MQVTVEPEALDAWSADARRTAARLTARLTELDDHLPVAWTGAAADGFRARHRQWRTAATDLLDALVALAVLVETAAANYRAAAAANARTWRGDPVVAVEAAGTGRGRISADVEELRNTAGSIGDAVHELGTAWTDVGAALAGTATMAGGDDVGTAFAADYNATAEAAWQGWRSSALLVDGIAGGIASTANEIIKAERRSTAHPVGPAPPKVVTAAAPPAPAPPPVVAGGPAGGPLTAHWPTADVTFLRAAARAWRGGVEPLRGAVRKTGHFVGRLADAHPDPALQAMRRFTTAALSDDPTSGLTGVLAVTGERLSAACDGFADLTERTRGRILDTVDYYAAGEEWYHPVADVVDSLVRFRVAHAIAAAADAYLLDLDLTTIHDEHVRAVDLLRGELHPAAADRLARIATAMVPPTPVSAASCAVTATGGPAVPEAQREQLIAEVAAHSDRIAAAEVLQITRGWDGRPVWIARGNTRGGLQHLLRPDRVQSFLDIGVASTEIPGVALRAVAQGPPLGRTEPKGSPKDLRRRPGQEPAMVYAIDVGGTRRTIAVVKGANGFVVTAYPYPHKIWPL